MPDWKPEILSQLSSLKLEPARGFEIIEELSQHMDDRFDELVSRGCSEDEARRTVLQELSNRGLLAKELEPTEPQIKKEPIVLGAGGGQGLAGLLQDVRHGVRMLRKNPGFTAVAVLTLALGIGATTTIFTVAYGVLLKPLPLPQSERLVNIFEKGPGGGFPKTPVSAQNYLDCKARAKSFTALTCFQSAAANVGADRGTPERWNGVAVHDDFFKVVGVNPALGIPFAPEHFIQGANGVVILSHGVWQERFAGDSNVLGKTISLNDRVRTVIGVMPPGFQTPGQSRVWLPKIFNNQELMDRNAKAFAVLGRLRPDVTAAQATSEVAAIAENLARDFPDLLKGWSAFVLPVLENFTQPARLPLLVLSAAVGVVLLMACINVANLLLARGASRVGEIATRSALGAARGRILRQLGVESLILALLGGIAGCLLAALLLKLVIAVAPAGLPRVNQVTLDYRALAFGVGVTALTSLIFGSAPAWQLAGVQPIWAMRDSAANTTARTGRVSKSLVAFQIAASLVVLVAAGLLLRSFDRLLRADLGFQPDELLTVRLELSPVKYSSEGRRDQFARALLEKLSALPGVESAAATTQLPLQGWGEVITRIEGRPSPPPSEAPSAGYAAVTPDYFRTLNIPILSGRGFAPTDDANAPKVGLINEAFARRFFPGENPIGRQVELGFASPPQWIEIIGIARNTRNESIENQPQAQVFTPLNQAPWFVGAPISVAIRTRSGATDLVPALREAVWSLDKDQPLHDLKPMKEVLFQATAQRRFTLIILGVFAALVLLLTLVGLYGVLAYAASKRTREMGIRMALGAQRGDVFRLVLREGALLTMSGIAAGLLGALSAVSVMRSLLYETAPTDPTTFVTIALLLCVAAMLACWLPALRAASVDPMAALRYE
jgi:putative ABC transport system permease protein